MFLLHCKSISGEKPEQSLLVGKKSQETPNQWLWLEPYRHTKCMSNIITH